MGIGFGLLTLILGPSVWVGVAVVSRVVIPLTLSFNLLIRQEKPLPFLIWFVIGNIGMLSELAIMVKRLGGWF